MIGRLRGELVEKTPPRLLLDVNGVGYELESPMSTIFELPPTGSTVQLVVHFHVREDAQILYGFLTELERTLFRQLLKVTGIGAKMALAILSGMNPREFALVVGSADTAALVRLPGVGKKTAERLIIEMRDKVEDISDAASAIAGASGSLIAGDPVAEATEALVSLGYKPADASKMIRKIAKPEHSSEVLIRLALKGAL